VKSHEDGFSDNINALFNDFTKAREVSADTDENFLDSYYNLYNELAN
jgi:starch synthase